MGSKKTETTISLSAAHAARIQALFDSRHYSTQTMDQLLETIVGQGIKAIEKRRAATAEAQIERAKATLAKAGIQTTSAA